MTATELMSRFENLSLETLGVRPKTIGHSNDEKAWSAAAKILRKDLGVHACHRLKMFEKCLAWFVSLRMWTERGEHRTDRSTRVEEWYLCRELRKGGLNPSTARGTREVLSTRP